MGIFRSRTLLSDKTHFFINRPFIVKRFKSGYAAFLGEFPILISSYNPRLWPQQKTRIYTSSPTEPSRREETVLCRLLSTPRLTLLRGCDAKKPCEARTPPLNLFNPRLDSASRRDLTDFRLKRQQPCDAFLFSGK